MKTKNSGLGLLLILALIFAGWFFWPSIESVIIRPTLVPPVITPLVITIPEIGLPTPTPVLEAQATALADRAVPIPTEEFAYLQANDLAGLQIYLDGHAKNWASVSQNVWTLDIAGVAPWSLTATSGLGSTRTITWTAVWKGNAIGGLNSQFGLPTVTLDNDWIEVARTQSITQTNLTIVELRASATVTFTGNVCVTGVEHWDFTPIHYGDYTQAEVAGLHTPTGPEWSYMLDPENHHSYSLWTDEVTSGFFPPEVTLDDHFYVRQMAEGSAKVIAHENSRIERLMGLVETAVYPGGSFNANQIEPNFSDQIASLYRVRGFTIVINLTRLTDAGGRILRCDSSPVLR